MGQSAAGTASGPVPSRDSCGPRVRVGRAALKLSFGTGGRPFSCPRVRLGLFHRTLIQSQRRAQLQTVTPARFSVALPEPALPQSAPASLPPIPGPAEQPSSASVSSTWEERLRGPWCGAGDARRPRRKRVTDAVQPRRCDERLKSPTSSTGSATRGDPRHLPLSGARTWASSD